ncbi:MAG: hypothetical protein AAFZ07_08530 [Actinomycetota bacterium]
MSGGSLASRDVTALNLPEHARNPIHTDAGAVAAGFPAALVAGVSTYAYLTHVPMAAWGLDWVASGGAEVRFELPVFDRDRLRCVVAGQEVRATVDGSVRATAQLWREAAPVPPSRDGDALEPYVVELGPEWVGLAARLGDPQPVLEAEGIVHPGAWPDLANQVVHRQLARGAWIHTRSRIQHHALAHLGGRAELTSTVVDRFRTRTGERAVLDVLVRVDGEVVASIEHEAIVALAG